MGASEDAADSSLLDVTGLSLTALADLDARTIDRALARMLPPRGATAQCDGGDGSGRLWQKHAGQSRQ
jgi:hypothetical protein